MEDFLEGVLRDFSSDASVQIATIFTKTTKCSDFCLN